jgi:hypothetical protein
MHFSVVSSSLIFLSTAFVQLWVVIIVYIAMMFQFVKNSSAPNALLLLPLTIALCLCPERLRPYKYNMYGYGQRISDLER